MLRQTASKVTTTCTTLEIRFPRLIVHCPGLLRPEENGSLSVSDADIRQYDLDPLSSLIFLQIYVSSKKNQPRDPATSGSGIETLCRPL